MACSVRKCGCCGVDKVFAVSEPVARTAFGGPRYDDPDGVKQDLFKQQECELAVGWFLCLHCGTLHRTVSRWEIVD
jgi:hypothetical protein